MPRQNHQSISSVQFRNRQCPLTRESEGDMRQTCCQMVRALRSPDLEGQRILDTPGIIDDQQEAALTDGSTHCTRPGLLAIDILNFRRRDTEQLSPARKMA